MHILAMLAALIGLSQASPHTKFYELRSVNLTLDAVDRTAAEVRARIDFRGQMPKMRVTQGRFAGAADLKSAGIPAANPGQYMLVQVQSVFLNRDVEVDSYAYDPLTRLLRYQSVHVIRVKRVKPDCHQ